MEIGGWRFTSLTSAICYDQSEAAVLLLPPSCPGIIETVDSGRSALAE